MKFLMNTGRTVNQGASVENKRSAAYNDETGTCFMHLFDMMDLGVDERENVRVTSPFGEVVLRVVSDEHLKPGTIFVPYGPYANYIIDGETHSTGMPDFKSTRVTIEPTDEARKTIYELMEEIGGLAYDH
jgi:formylmethanofuran dehydrogenase subunit D